MTSPSSPSSAVREVPRWFAGAVRLLLVMLKPFLPGRVLGWLEHAAWFLFVGGVNTLASYILFVVFLNLFSLNRIASLLLAYALGALIAYMNFSRLVFAGGGGRAFVRFLPAYVLLYLCNQGLLELLVRTSGWGEEASQLCLLPVVAALSYLFNRLLVFRPPAG